MFSAHNNHGGVGTMCVTQLHSVSLPILHFGVVFSSSVRNVGFLIEILINLYISFGSIANLTIFVMSFQAQEIFYSFSDIPFYFCFQSIVVFIVEVFHFLDYDSS